MMNLGMGLVSFCCEAPTVARPMLAPLARAVDRVLRRPRPTDEFPRSLGEAKGVVTSSGPKPPAAKGQLTAVPDLPIPQPDHILGPSPAIERNASPEGIAGDQYGEALRAGKRREKIEEETVDVGSVPGWRKTRSQPRRQHRCRLGGARAGGRG